MAPDSRATARAKEIAWDAIAPAYHEGMAEAAEDAFLEHDLGTRQVFKRGQELSCWIVEEV
jgi:hypothetical protein